MLAYASPSSVSYVPAPSVHSLGVAASLRCSAGLTNAVQPLRWLSGGTEITRTPKPLRVQDGKAAQLACKDPVKALLLLPRGSEGPPDPSQQSWDTTEVGPQQTLALQGVTDPGKKEESTASRERRGKQEAEGMQRVRSWDRVCIRCWENTKTAGSEDKPEA